MDIFTAYIYQPFFNILVWLYWFVEKTSGVPDMGIAVILFAVAVRVILLPLDYAAERSDEEKFQIANKIKLLQKEFSDNPIRLREETKKVMRQSPWAIISEIFNTIIQLIIIVMLYRIFKTGLEGEDMHLLYSFMPEINQPINLLFLGKYDLSHTNSLLNLIQSLMIALNEFLQLYFSEVKSSRRDFVSLVVIFPIFSFLVFMLLPAGKKVFIITSLAFSVVVRLGRQAVYLAYSMSMARSEEQKES